MSIKITDCTIRDGGYLLNKNSDPEFIRGVMTGLSAAGIDFVETGFLQTNVTGETLVYRDSKDARKFLPSERGDTEFLGFCDNSRYSSDNLDKYDGYSFKWLRISFAKHEIDDAINFCQKAQDKGYIVQFNPMDAISYTDEEREVLIDKVNIVRPGSMSIVDTFGAMYLEDLYHIFKQVNSQLAEGIAIGLHSHDNLGLSNALAETLIMLAEDTERDIIVDGSLLGMGRGAGNACTELLASYINKYHSGKYNLEVLMDTIEKYIIPLRNNICWGYDLSMFVCGTGHAHVDNVYHLQKKGCSVKDMYTIIETMPVEQRTRYGKNYSKTDFTLLDRAMESYSK